MASVSRIEADIDAWSLLHGKLVVQHLWVTNPELLLEVSAAGEGNWPTIAGWGVKRPYMPEIHEIKANSGVTTFHSMATGAQTAVL